MAKKYLTKMLEEIGFSRITRCTFKSNIGKRKIRRVEEFILYADPTTTYARNELDKSFPRFMATFKSKDDYSSLRIYRIDDDEVINSVLRGIPISLHPRISNYSGKDAIKMLPDYQWD